MKRECWCPICEEMTGYKWINWLWFFVFLILGLILFYLIYTAVTSKVICARCKNRIPYYSDREDWERKRPALDVSVRKMK